MWSLTAKTHVQLKTYPASDIPNLKPELIVHAHAHQKIWDNPCKKKNLRKKSRYSDHA